MANTLCCCRSTTQGHVPPPSLEDLLSPHSPASKLPSHTHCTGCQTSNLYLSWGVVPHKSTTTQGTRSTTFQTTSATPCSGGMHKSPSVPLHTMGKPQGGHQRLWGYPNRSGGVDKWYHSLTTTGINKTYTVAQSLVYCLQCHGRMLAACPCTKKNKTMEHIRGKLTPCNIILLVRFERGVIRVSYHSALLVVRVNHGRAVLFAMPLTF